MLARNMIETKSLRVEHETAPASTVHCEEARGGLPIEARHVAEYIEDMLGQLKDMSIRANFTVLACLIEAARQEADDRSRL